MLGHDNLLAATPLLLPCLHVVRDRARRPVRGDPGCDLRRQVLGRSQQVQSTITRGSGASTCRAFAIHKLLIAAACDTRIRVSQAVARPMWHERCGPPYVAESAQIPPHRASAPHSRPRGCDWAWCQAPPVAAVGVLTQAPLFVDLASSTTPHTPAAHCTQPGSCAPPAAGPPWRLSILSY
eukprot:COSAG01_NODE_812_length_13409_cov_20.449812_4_plen_181_part_00